MTSLIRYVLTTLSSLLKIVGHPTLKHTYPFRQRVHDWRKVVNKI
jgi:hypothetical protein